VSYLKTIHDDAARATVFGPNYVLATPGVFLPHLVEILSKEDDPKEYISSVVISIVALVILPNRVIICLC
jgi:hypothetical protein